LCFDLKPVRVITTEEAYPMSTGLRSDTVKKNMQNDQLINLSNFYFGPKPVRVITMEEAYPMSTRLRLDAVKKYV